MDTARVVNGFSCNSSSPSLREEALFQSTLIGLCVKPFNKEHGDLHPVCRSKSREGHEDVLRAGTFLWRHSGRTLWKSRLQGESEPFPVSKGTPRELQMDFGQGLRVAGPGELLPEGKCGILGRNSSL